MNFYLITAAATGPIDWILRLFGRLLAFFDSLTGFYIISIFLFALLAKLALFPLGIRQQKNSIKQAKLRPKEQAIRNKYKGRTDQVTMNKMQQEIMDLYQSEGYSMYGGCLPMLLQFPLILGLYEIIRNPLLYTCGLSNETVLKIRDTINFLGTDVIKGADNLFKNGLFTGASGLDYMTILKDPDNFTAITARFDFGLTYDQLPNFDFFGLDLSVTPMSVFSDWSLWFYLFIPLLTFGAMYISMKLTKKFTYQPDPQPGQNKISMKIMDLAMPLLSTYFAFMFPSMLGVYWMFNNLLGILQSFILSKMYPIPQFSEEEYKAAERELKGKRPANAADDSRVVEGKKYVSLHHIDDDDYDEKGNFIGKPEQNDEQPAQPKTTAHPDKNAPKLKDDSPRSGKFPPKKK